MREIKSVDKILKTLNINDDQLSFFLWNENCCDGLTMWCEDQVAEDIHRITKKSMKKNMTIWVLNLDNDGYFFLVPKGTRENKLQDIIIERIKKKLARGASFEM